MSDLIRSELESPLTHIFISYSREDQAYAKSLAGWLRGRGTEPWLDDHIEFGERWWQTIVTAIRECAAFLVVMTPESEQSEWVEREVLLAQKENKLIIPLLLRGEVFSLLIETQYVDVTKDQMPPPELFDRLRRTPLEALPSAVESMNVPEVGTAAPKLRDRRSGVDVTGLEVRFLRKRPYWVQQTNREYFRLGVYNHGPDVATNVKVWLDDITPRPRDTRFDLYADFPYSRKSVDEETDYRNINPNDEMLFRVLSWWVGGSGPQSGLQIWDVMIDNLGPTSFLIEPDEQWILRLRVSSGNYNQLDAILVKHVDDGSVRLYLDGPLQRSVAPTGILESGIGDVSEHTNTTIASSIIPPLPGIDPRAGRPTEELSLRGTMQRLMLELKGNIGLTGWGIGDMPTDWLDRLHDQPEYLLFPVELQQAIETVLRRSRGLKSMPRSSANRDHASYVAEAERLVALLERHLSDPGRST